MYGVTFIQFAVSTLIPLPALFRSDRHGWDLTAMLTVRTGRASPSRSSNFRMAFNELPLLGRRCVGDAPEHTAERARVRVAAVEGDRRDRLARRQT